VGRHRRFGFLKLFSANELETYLAGQKFGPEPLASGFDRGRSFDLLCKKTAR